MISKPYVVDFDYVREEMKRAKGCDSYRVMLVSFPGLGQTTAFRFLNGQRDLDLKNFLIVVNALDLDIQDVIIERSVLEDF